MLVYNLLAIMLVVVGASLALLSVIIIWLFSQSEWIVAIALVGILMIISGIFLVGLKNRPKEHRRR